jgi:hypothetical protein
MAAEPPFLDVLPTVTARCVPAILANVIDVTLARACRRKLARNKKRPRLGGATVRGAPVPDQKLLRAVCSMMRAKPSAAMFWAGSGIATHRCG